MLDTPLSDEELAGLTKLYWSGGNTDWRLSPDGKRILTVGHGTTIATIHHARHDTPAESRAKGELIVSEHNALMRLVSEVRRLRAAASSKT